MILGKKGFLIRREEKESAYEELHYSAELLLSLEVVKRRHRDLFVGKECP